MSPVGSATQVYNLLDPSSRPGSWIGIRAKPHTGGLIHSKLLLFRTDVGLRVVVCGSNLMQQWEGDRDMMWIQDFRLCGRRLGSSSSSKTSSSSSSSSNSFGTRLRNFTDFVSGCENPSAARMMQQRVAAIFNGVDFSDAKGELVDSTPRPRPRSSTTKNSSTKQLQGIPRLAEAVNCLHAKTPLVSRVVSSTAASKKRCDLKLYCMQGSMGDLKADFLYEIQNAMTGRTGAAARSISKKVSKKVTKKVTKKVKKGKTKKM